MTLKLTSRLPLVLPSSGAVGQPCPGISFPKCVSQSGGSWMTVKGKKPMRWFAHRSCPWFNLRSVSACFALQVCRAQTAGLCRDDGQVSACVCFQTKQEMVFCTLPPRGKQLKKKCASAVQTPETATVVFAFAFCLTTLKNKNCRSFQKQWSYRILELLILQTITTAPYFDTWSLCSTDCC